MTGPLRFENSSPDAAHQDRLLGRRSEQLLVFLMPAPHAEEIIGDLIEEARNAVMPVKGTAAARRWVWRQSLVSLPPLLRLHLRKEMKSSGKLWGIAAILGMGSVQAWDSGILRAPAAIGAVVVIAMIIGIVALLFSENPGTRFAAALASIILLLGARILSPVSLPGLGLVGFIVMIVLVFVPVIAAAKNGPRGPTNAAL